MPSIAQSLDYRVDVGISFIRLVLYACHSIQKLWRKDTKLFFFYLRSLRVPNHVDDDGDVHHQGDEAGHGQLGKWRAFGGLGHGIHIAELDEKVASLNTNVTSLKEDNEKKEETITSQDKALHTAWFVFGTKDELKEQRILSKDGLFSKTKLLEKDFNKDYFTKIDIRIDKEIKLYSKSAQIMTSHPAGSYTLQRDANKQFVLRISDPDTFWSTSKYLVVLVK